MPDQGRRDVLKTLAGLGAAATVGPQIALGDPAADRYIIDTGDGVSREDKIRANGTDLEIIHELEHVGYLVVRGAEEEAAEIGVDYSPDIELEREIGAEVPDELSNLDEAAGSESIAGTEDSEPLGHDGPVGDLPYPDAYGWDVDLLNLDEAHEINQGTKPSGDSVRVGIIDDGVYQHEDLDVVDGIDLTGDGEDPYHPNAQHYHGTHVGGIVAAHDSGGERGVIEAESSGGGVGVAPQAELVSLRYFSTAGAFFGDFAAAVEAAIITDCDVINASLGFVNDLPESRAYLIGYIENYIEDLADIADQNGIVWVASAGNSANNANDLVPGSAKADNVLSVSSVGPTGMSRPDGEDGRTLGDPLEPATTPANYTTHGNEYVDVSAPGGSWDLYDGLIPFPSFLRAYLAPDAVLSTFPPDTIYASLYTGNPLPGWIIPRESFVNRENYGFLQGTSMSAPQVAGVAALLSAENPDWSPREIRRVIKATARNVGKTTYHGHGLVDPVAALEVDDPADVRGQLGRPGDRDDRGRNESGGGSPRNSSGGSGGSNRGRSRGDDDDDDDSRSR